MRRYDLPAFFYGPRGEEKMEGLEKGIVKRLLSKKLPTI